MRVLLRALLLTVCALVGSVSAQAASPNSTSNGTSNGELELDALPVVCSSVCMPNQCVGGGKSYECTKCVSDRHLVLQPGKTYGRCITCASNCAIGKCVGERGDECTECVSTKLLIKNKGLDYGTCIQCPGSCKDKQCVGERGDQCTGCDFPKTLVNLLSGETESDKVGQLPATNFSGSSSAIPKVVGTCTACVSSCLPSKCVGPGSDQCTECPPERAFRAVGNSSHGLCLSCASNCLQAHCQGPHSYQCTKCIESKVLIPFKDGPYAGKGFGTCVACAGTCKPLMCVGSGSAQCTECGAGRSLVPKEGKTYGECPANSVLSNKFLRARLEQQQAELASLREAKTLRLKQRMARRQSMLRESRGTNIKSEDPRVQELGGLVHNPLLPIPSKA